LAGVLIFLSAYAYFFELQRDGEEKSQRLLKFNAEEVEGIVLNYPQHEIRLKKEPSGKWKITQPLHVAADESAIQSILTTLSASGISRTVEQKPGPDDLKAFGLDQPSVELSITLRNGITLPSIFIGSRTPFGDSAYVKRGTEPSVLLSGASLRSSLEKSLNDLRNKEILPFPPDQVAKLQIHTPKQSWALIKGDKREWQVEAPNKGKIKQAVVGDYLRALGALRAKTFVEDQPKDLKKYGLGPPSVKISLDAKDGKPLGTLLLGGRSGAGYYAKRDGEPTVYTIEEFSYKQIDRQLTDFIEEEKK
jgi:hypothetical protein